MDYVKMDYSKKIFFILLIVLAIAAIIVSVYAVKFFNLKSEETQKNISATAEKEKNFESAISMPTDACKIASDAKSGSFSFTITSLDVEKTKQDLLNIVNRYGGKNLTYNSSTRRNPQVGLNLDVIYFNFAIPINQADAFAKEVRKLAASPNSFTNDNFSTQDAENLQQECQGLLSDMRGSQAQEKLNLSQMQRCQEKECSEENNKTLIENVSGVRSDARYSYDSIQDLMNNRLGNLQVNITIEESPLG